MLEITIDNCYKCDLDTVNDPNENLGLCLYEYICAQQELILMSEESFIWHDVENKPLKEENKKLKEENEKFRKENENEKREMTNDNEQLKKKT